jgi:hypothetical protein
MCRDRPTYDPMSARRCTCLTSGTEWFITTDLLDGMQTVSCEITDCPKAWAL